MPGKGGRRRKCGRKILFFDPICNICFFIKNDYLKKSSKSCR